MSTARCGIVIFTADVERLSRFYEGVTSLRVVHRESTLTVMASEEFELVVHSLVGEPSGSASLPRLDAYVKPFFRVAALAEARRRAAELGGAIRPAQEEWSARGFRACEASDPDGNPIQFREELS